MTNSIPCTPALALALALWSMALLTSLPNVYACVSGGSLMEMFSKGQVLLVNSGEEVQLNCEFTADSRFNLFDNPVWWRKAQRHEETQVNMMGNVLEPFESTQRFSVTFHSRPPNYTLRLTIAGHQSN